MAGVNTCATIVCNNTQLNIFVVTVPGVLYTLVTIIGLIGCSVSLIALINSKGRFEGLRPYLIYLSIWDWLLLINGWCVFSLPSLLFGCDIQMHGYMVYVYFLFYPMANITLTGCVWANVACAVERYLAICHPFCHRRMSRTVRLRATVVASSIVAILFNTPRWFEYQLDICRGSSGSMHPLLYAAPVLDNALYLLVYFSILQNLFVNMGPFVLLLLMNLQIARALKRSERLRSKSDCMRETREQNNLLEPDDNQRLSVEFRVQKIPEANSSAARRSSHLLDTSTRDHHDKMTSQKPAKPDVRRRNQITRMLILMILKFLVCYTISLILNVMHASMKDDVTSSEPYRYLSGVNDFMVMMHSASNFVIYLWFDKRLKGQVLDLMRCSCLRTTPAPMEVKLSACVRHFPLTTGNEGF